eukprot:GILK01003053.1.p1 GENE.GILK01003053.1~~GILK01003053.1.p1  ORF type:complete len:296 (+),score=42.01 GILK01003053.1:57-944(+)
MVTFMATWLLPPNMTFHLARFLDAPTIFSFIGSSKSCARAMDQKAVWWMLCRNSAPEFRVLQVENPKLAFRILRQVNAGLSVISSVVVSVGLFGKLGKLHEASYLSQLRGGAGRSQLTEFFSFACLLKRQMVRLSVTSLPPVRKICPVPLSSKHLFVVLFDTAQPQWESPLEAQVRFLADRSHASIMAIGSVSRHTSAADVEHQSMCLRALKQQLQLQVQVRLCSQWSDETINDILFAMIQAASQRPARAPPAMLDHNYTDLKPPALQVVDEPETSIRRLSPPLQRGLPRWCCVL